MAASAIRWVLRAPRWLALAGIVAGAALAQAGNAVSTLAGTPGVGGFFDATGPAAAFQFNATSGAAVDGTGNVYVADSRNHTIRRITSDGVVTTFAGSTTGAAGWVDDTGTAARFNNPAGLAIDGTGNLFVADAGNHVIRMITPAGVVTTLAGSGSAGFVDAAGANAQFQSPKGVAVAPGSGAAVNVYVADTYNNALRRVEVATRTVTTVAGDATGIAGLKDGVGNAALFRLPTGIVVDPTETTMYVADTGNNAIRKLTLSGGSATVTLIAGAGASGYANGTGTTARFLSPTGVAIDATGNVLVTDAGNQVIRSVTPAGLASLSAGTPSTAGSADGLVAVATFNAPAGITVLGSTAYVVDSGNSIVRKICPAAIPTITADPVGMLVTVGTAATFVASVSATPPATYRWQRRAATALTYSDLTEFGAYSGTTTKTLTVFPTTSAMNGDLYRLVATNTQGSANSGAGKLTVSSGLVLTTLAGSAGVGGAADGTGAAARFWSPTGLAVTAAGTVYVADSTNAVIRAVSPTGVVTTLAGQFGVRGSTDASGTAALFGTPSALALDSAGNLYVADTLNQTIRKIQGNGTVTTVAGATGLTGSTDAIGTAARFSYPGGIAVDSAGVLYVADTLNHTIRKIATDGTVSTLAGLAGTPGSADGNGSTARFNQPYGVAVDGSGNVYVADMQNSTIRKITPTGAVTTLAGAPGVVGSADGTGSAATFNLPRAIAVANATTLYVADTANQTIRQVLTTGAVTTVAGTPGSVGSTDGIGPAIQFNQPSAVTVDARGNVYVADTRSNILRRTTILIAPVILTQPTSLNAFAESTVSFHTAATGTPAPAYQWQRQPAGVVGFTNLTDGGNVSGSRTDTLTISNLTTALSTDQYRVVVTTGVSPDAISAAATLFVAPVYHPPVITSQPVDVTVNPGGTASFTVSATGTPPLQYQWWKSSGSITGATAATLTIANAQASDIGAYAVFVSSPYGNSASKVVNLGLNIAPTITAGQTARLGFAGGSLTLDSYIIAAPGTIYQWRKNGAAIAGATNATVTFANLTVDDTGLYDLVATNSLGTAATSRFELMVAPGAVPPIVTSQPAARTVTAGATTTFSVAYNSPLAATVQWRKDGAPIAGATNTVLTLANVQTADAGGYDAVVTSAAGSTTAPATPASLRVLPQSYAGTYLGKLSNGLGSFALYVRADNTAAFVGVLPMWAAPLINLDVVVSDAGTFTFQQPAQTTAPIGLTPLGTIAVAVSIADTGVVSGTLSGPVEATLSATRSDVTGATQALAGYYLARPATGPNFTATIVDATGRAFALTLVGGSAAGGIGTASAAGQVTVSTAQTTLAANIDPATQNISATTSGAVTAAFTGTSEAAMTNQRLANISTRAWVGGRDSVAIAGFVIGGSNEKLLLIRAMGPTLKAYGVAGALAKPRLDLFRGATLIATNLGVGTATSAADAATAAGVMGGAFAPTPDPADAALVVTLPPGQYTAQVSASDGGTGVALAEVYDLSANDSGQKLVNISTRANVRTGESAMFAGVVVSGQVPKRILVRAVGPGLAPFIASGYLAQPVLTLQKQGTGEVVAQNAGWAASADAAVIAAASVRVGGFPMVANDSAILVTLPPGSYSAQVTGAGGTTGIALVEIYDVP